MNTLNGLKHTKQQGYILLLTLVMLVMITVLALSLVSQNTSQTRLAANATDREITFEKAEGALNEGINSIIFGTYSPFSFSLNTNGLYQLNPEDAPLWTTINWSSSNAVINSFQGNTGTAASYFIEQLPSVIQPGQNMSVPTQIYRITTRAIGANGNTAIFLQATVQIQ